jgi:succinate dehydrogenase/fumarate reductase flavoprotein subunit
LGGKTQTFAPLEILPTTRMSACWPNYPGVEHTESRWVAGEIGKEGRVAAPLWKLLVDNVERRGIEVMTSTPAKELITNEKGEVIGVVAEREGRVISIKAKRAVVLTCGGFEYNDAMKDAYLPLTPIYPIGTPGNTGDGLIMAQKVGAALWHMNQFYGWPVFQ